MAIWPFRSKRQAPPEIAAPLLPVKREPRISWQAATAFGPKRDDAQSALVIPAPFPGVVPSGGHLMANDTAVRLAYDYAENYGNPLGGLGWPGFTYLAELTQRPEYRRISESFAKEMTRKWIKLHSGGDGDKTDRLTAIDQEMKRLRVQDVYRQVAEHDGFFGRAHVYLDMGLDERDELLTPLFLDKAKIPVGGLKRIRIIEPMWTYPGLYNSTNPLASDYYRPSSWYVMGKEVHVSRLPTFIGREMPDLLKPAYMFGGLSLSQMAQPYVQNWLRTRQSVSDLLHSFSVSGIKTNMGAALQGGGSENMIARAEMFNRARDNRGMFMIDKETEEFFNVSTPLSSLDKLQAQAQEQIASVAGIPLTILLGITPSGLNASSEGEIRTFYAWVEAQQNDLMRDNLTRLIKVIQLSLFGDIDPDIDFSFVPLWTMDEKAQADLRKVNADTAAVYINAGVLLPEEERQRLAAEDEGVFSNLDLSEPLPPPPEPGADPNDDPDAGPETDDAGSSGNEPGGNPPPPKQQPTVGQGQDEQSGIGQDAEWQEGDHPRAPDGKFGKGNGSGATGHPAPHPLSKTQVTMHGIATSDKAHADKVNEISTHVGLSAAGGSTAKYGAKLLKSLGATPLLEPGQLKSTLPAPHPLSTTQVLMHQAANHASTTHQQKLNYIQHKVKNADPKGSTAKYGEKLLKALGPAPEDAYTPIDEPVAAEPAETGHSNMIPAPHASSPQQQQLHEDLTTKAGYHGLGSNTQKIDYIKDKIATTMDSGFAKSYAEQCLSALGYNPPTSSYQVPTKVSNAIYAAAKQAPHAYIETVSKLEGAKGVKIKARLVADTERITGDYYAKVTAAYGEHPEDAMTSAVDDAMHDYSMEVEYTPDQRDSVGSYQGQGYGAINDHLLNGGGSKSIQTRVGHIRAAIAANVVPADTPVWRGLACNLKTLTGFDDPQLAVGRCFEHKNFASVSRSHLTSSGFGDRTMLKFTIPAGTPGLVMAGQDGVEREIMLADRSMFRVDKVEQTVSFDGAANHTLHVTYLGTRED